MRIGIQVKTALFIGALFLLLGNGLVLYKYYGTDWRTYQKEYLRMAVEKTTDPQMKALLAARSPRIEQIVVTRFGEKRIDRCVTCHAGIDDQRFTDAPQPFRTHPPVPGNHDFQEFGCTTCHDGNGRGLTVEEAHGEVEFWKDPVLTGDYIETGCAKCHPAPYLPQTPMLAKGAELFKTKACYGCHKVEGVSNGKLGIELTRVGAKWPVEYLRESIVDPKANNVESLMPKMDLTDEEVKALVIYLKSLTGENLVDGSVSYYKKMKEWKAQEPPEVPVTVESGRRVFETKGCNACHTINGVGGQIGPDLSVYGLQRTKEWMIQHHINPRTLIAGSMMPDFDYSQSELEALALYLSTLKKLTVDNRKVYRLEETP